MQSTVHTLNLNYSPSEENEMFHLCVESTTLNLAIHFNMGQWIYREVKERRKDWRNNQVELKGLKAKMKGV